ncbi:hypothetical protein C4D60_Mb02t21940 [Musa balbisiana]|uniref:Uncharacterized protein n=1 Tax=Musa balbisiana TaxID=52838 RepID=A0A4S8ICG7_MUSBA|nr:hypothetical protein C4D60_Mb02t21940 [Musa balbisiana]
MPKTLTLGLSIAMDGDADDEGDSTGKGGNELVCLEITVH